MPASRPRSASGIVWFHIVTRKMPLTASAPPARARQTSAGHSVSQKPNPTMATPQTGRGQHHREAVAVHARRPAAGQAGDQRAHRGRGVEQAEHAGPPSRLGQRREERERHAEDHRHEVDHVGPDQLLPAAGVAEALADALEARALGAFAAAARRGSGARPGTRRRRSATSNAYVAVEACASRSGRRRARGRRSCRRCRGTSRAPPRPGSRPCPRGAASAPRATAAAAR